MDLEKEVKEGKFREDLLYRIKVLSIDLPPLRKREEDVLALAEHFLTQCGRLMGRSKMFFAESAKKKLSRWHWPGNIRELKNIIDKAVVSCSSNIIRQSDLCINDEAIEEPDKEFRSYQAAKDNAMENFERDYLTKVLKENNWNITRAAHQACKDRKSFYRLLAKHELM